MASDIIVGPISIPASANFNTTFAGLTSRQFTFQKVDTNGQLAAPSSGGNVVGVLQDKPTAQGQPGQICGPGSVTKVVAAAAIAAGALVSTDSSGKAVTSTTGAEILGQALEAVSNANDIFRVRFMPMGKA